MTSTPEDETGDVPRLPVIAGTDDSKEDIMLKKEIRTGHVYAVKVGETIRPVRIDTVREFPSGGRTITRGWTGTNLETGRTVTIRSAARCRYEMAWPQGDAAQAGSVRGHMIR